MSIRGRISVTMAKADSPESYTPKKTIGGEESANYSSHRDSNINRQMEVMVEATGGV